MAWLDRVRAAGVAGVGALMLLGVGCSDDKPSEGGKGDESGESDEGLDVSSPEGEIDEEPKDAGSRMDAKIMVPDMNEKPDAGDSGPALTLPDGSEPPTAVPDAAVINNALTPLPHDGERGSICYGNGDCTGDDLKCLLPAGSAIPGICVDDCDTSTDCKSIDEVKGACNNGDLAISSGLCEYPCGGPKNDGKGKCPEDMVCENFSTNFLFPDWQCRYPAGGGKKTEKPFTKCETAHEGGDCEGLSWCWQPSLSLSSAVLPHGYCSPVCTQDSDCKGADEGTTAKPFCFGGTCQFDCGVTGARCPLGMNCWEIESTAVLRVQRCIFID
jgi:hypothetical protein